MSDGSDSTRLRPPSGGMAPPSTATLTDGTQLDLLPLARAITEEHLVRHPDELERYGEAVRAWCTHDNQHLLHWAALDLAQRRPRRAAALAGPRPHLPWLPAGESRRRPAHRGLPPHAAARERRDARAGRSPRSRRRDARRVPALASAQGAGRRAQGAGAGRVKSRHDPGFRSIFAGGRLWLFPRSA